MIPAVCLFLWPEALGKAYDLAKERLLAEIPKIIEALKKL